MTCHGGVKDSLFATRVMLLCGSILLSTTSILLPSQIMAYNREWDETWASANYGNNTWNNGASNIRSREEEFYGEGKRRKYNNGVRHHINFCYHIF